MPGTSARRPVPAGRGRAVLYPAVAEAARRIGADALGLIDVGRSAGLALQLDRVGITYGDGATLGDPGSPVQLGSSVVGERPVPPREVPAVVARVAVGPDPIDVTDPDDVRWVRARLWPDHPDRAALVDGELELLSGAPPELLRGDPLDRLPEALAHVPGGALPVVTTTWALSSLAPADRLRFLHRLDDAAAGRVVVWVSVEGVGVAPAVPTLGDRRASGHSIVGLAILEASALRVEVVGRCWSRGRWTAWLADS